MSEKPVQQPQSASELFRERIAAIVGVLIVLTFLIVAILAVYAGVSTNTPSGSFDSLKDLLIFLSGFVGTVLGYYYGRMPAEKRAETAEATMQIAQSAWNQAEREAAQAVARLDVEGLAREAAEKTKELAEEAKQQAESRMEEMGEVVTEITEGMQTMRTRVETFKQQLSAAGEAAGDLGDLVLGAEGEGEAVVPVSTEPLDEVTDHIDELLRKAERVQRR